MIGAARVLCHGPFCPGRYHGVLRSLEEIMWVDICRLPQQLEIPKNRLCFSLADFTGLKVDVVCGCIMHQEPAMTFKNALSVFRWICYVESYHGRARIFSWYREN